MKKVFVILCSVFAFSLFAVGAAPSTAEASTPIYPPLELDTPIYPPLALVDTPIYPPLALVDTPIYPPLALDTPIYPPL
ncbi:hypothetical protein DRW41_09240 [Neobacillus piezotolerans]|uniref:Uncharacterized protein n=1 Tax=Neobacillus piezotolerans TaxID=2259171 RepID=A0A3D8GRN9_9BACI|nr:hypothetical protein [Neobacillus piezotolerans]RDU36879.1 hypothetical protein DRW41_09240 [Neobacillus piezotolerans]